MKKTMKNKYVEKQLEDITVPTLQTSVFESLLEDALMQSSYWKNHQKRVLFFLRGGENNIHIKKYITLGIIVVALVGVIFAVLSPLSRTTTQLAYAEQVAENSYNAVATLTPQQRETLMETVKANSAELLQEAKNSKDLQVLTYNQFMGENPRFGDIFLPSQKAGVKKPDLQDAKFLQFTDTNGAKVIIGVDANNDLPVLVIGMMKNGGDATFRTQGFGTGGFSTANAQAKGMIQITVDANGNNPVITANGKKYAIPQGVTIGPNNPPPSIKVEGSDLYVNGIKATPKQ
jgi:hypothetical protein